MFVSLPNGVQLQVLSMIATTAELSRMSRVSNETPAPAGIRSNPVAGVGGAKAQTWSRTACGIGVLRWALEVHAAGRQPKGGCGRGRSQHDRFERDNEAVQRLLKLLLRGRTEVRSLDKDTLCVFGCYRRPLDKLSFHRKVRLVVPREPIIIYDQQPTRFCFFSSNPKVGSFQCCRGCWHWVFVRYDRKKSIRIFIILVSFHFLRRNYFVPIGSRTIDWIGSIDSLRGDDEAHSFANDTDGIKRKPCRNSHTVFDLVTFRYRGWIHQTPSARPKEIRPRQSKRRTFVTLLTLFDFFGSRRKCTR